MPEYEIHHYVQKRRLDGFATRVENGKYKTCLLNLYNFSVEYRNTNRAMCVRNLYDVKGEDVKALEKKLNTNIERPMWRILKRLIKNPSQIILTRKELCIIKKYILIQIFRNRRNMTGYTNPPKGKVELSEYNIREGESKLDFWKREMTAILDKDWDELINSTDLVSVKKEAITLHSSFLMFFQTEGEFAVNDLGYVTERFPISIPKDKQAAYIEIAETLGKAQFGVDNFSEIAKREIANNTSYLDTCIWVPLSSNLVVAVANPFFITLDFDPAKIIEARIPSALTPYLCVPKKKFVNDAQIRANEEGLPEPLLIGKYKHDNDKYFYKTNLLCSDGTMHWNLLTLNEVFQYLCFKTPEAIIPAIKKYNELKSNGMANMKKNYSGFIDLLARLGKPQ